MIVIYLLMALLGSAATIFALQNREPVEIWFLTWSVRGIDRKSTRLNSSH